MSESRQDPIQAEILNTLQQLLLVNQQILDQLTQQSAQQVELLTALATGLTPFQGAQ